MALNGPARSKVVNNGTSRFLGIAKGYWSESKTVAMPLAGFSFEYHATGWPLGIKKQGCGLQSAGDLICPANPNYE